MHDGTCVLARYSTRNISKDEERLIDYRLELPQCVKFQQKIEENDWTKSFQLFV